MLGLYHITSHFVGVAYIIDTMYGNCTVQSIQQTFDTRYVDKNHLRIRNAREFFYFDVINYTYEGVVSSV